MEPIDNIALPPAQPQRRPWRRLLAIVGVIVAFLALIIAVRIGPLLLAPNSYAGVPTIEARADYRDPPAMARAMALPVARRYFNQPFEYQGNQSFCGPTSLANVLHSMGVSTSQALVIADSRYDPWFGVLIGGMTLDELADLARTRTGKAVSVRRNLSLPDFRREIAASNDPAWRIIVNFHRGPLFGRGHGHFSPVLGYLPDRDLVLVGDVNARFRPFLVSSERLWRGVDTIDGDTGAKRGLIIIAAR